MRVASPLAAAIVLAVSLLPLLGVVVAGSAANALGCTVNEAAVHPCPFLGMDIGGLLNFLGVMGWLMLVTLPIAAAAVLILAGHGLAGLVRRLRR